jgi:hypothetical protein
VPLFESPFRDHRSPAMKTFITAMTLVFLLATSTSMMALTLHTDGAHMTKIVLPERSTKKRLSFIEHVQTIP